MSYPTSIDSIPQPTPTSPTNNPSASGVSVAQTNAIVALETKVGTGASTPSTANPFFMATGTGSSTWETTATAGTALGLGSLALLDSVNLTTNVTGTLPIANGGTGQITSSAALTALLPSQASAADKMLVSNGTTASWSLIESSNIGSGAVTTSAIADGAVTSSTLAESAVLPNALVAGTGTSWEWQSWTPTWTNLTVGNGTVVAAYIQIGNTVFFRLALTFGSTTSITASDPSFTPPVAFNTAYTKIQPFGSVMYFHSSGIYYAGMCGVSYSASNKNIEPFAILSETTTYTTQYTGFGTAVPVAGGTGDVLVCNGSYQTG